MKTVGRFASEVYRIIKANSHITAGEAFGIYRINHPNTIRSRNEVAKRISDLQKLGLLTKVSMTTCAYTGALATTWEITGNDEDVRFSTAGAEPEAEFNPGEPAGAEETISVYTHSAPPAVNSFGCSFDEDDFDDEEVEPCTHCECHSEAPCAPEPIYNMPRDQKAEELTRLAGETVAAVDDDDLRFLRTCRYALDTIEERPMFRMAFKAFGLNGKVQQLRKALRYF
jgi:hypothetical protein